MKLNASMEGILRDLGTPIETLSIPVELDAVLKPGFVERNGSVVLTSQLARSSSVSLADFPDETGYECFVNHVHVGDLMATSASQPHAQLISGLAFAEQLCNFLRQERPKEEFKVIVAFDGKECTVRFHVVRAGQDWLRDDLNTYQDEAIMVLTTKS